MKLDIEYISRKMMVKLSYKVLKDDFLVVLLANNLIIEGPILYNYLKWLNIIRIWDTILE